MLERATEHHKAGLGNKDIALTCDDGQITLKKNRYYFDQVQGQMYLTKRVACVVAYWTPADVVLIPVTKDPLWDDKLAENKTC